MSRDRDNDTVDLGEIGLAFRRGKYWILGGLVLGLLLAFAAIRLLRPAYEASATVLLRTSNGAPSLLAGLGGLASVIPGGGGIGGSGLDTELEILTSRAVVGEVVDSLLMQAWVLEPKSERPTTLFSSARFEPRIERAEYRFERTQDGYAVEGPGHEGRAVPGEPYALPGAVVTLLTGGLPESFRVEIVGREEAITRIRDDLSAGEAAEEVAELTYKAPDPVLAAEVPNRMIAGYLVRRRTTDRGVNQHRYEFLTARLDSLGVELAVAERALRLHQESSGILDPQVSGEANLTRAMELSARLEAVEVETGALGSILEESAQGDLSAAELAAYPTFLENAAINDVLSRLLELETERVSLELRNDSAEMKVVENARAIEGLRQQLVALSRSYLAGLTRQRTELRRELAGYQGVLAAMPGQAEESLRRQREVRRLSETMLAVQAELVQARLGAISEGGTVREIDPAVVPEEPVFPNPLLFLLVGAVGGVLVGGVGALGREYLGSAVRDAYQAELATGVPALALKPGAPLLLGGLEEYRSVLVIPVGAGSRSGTIAQSLAATAALRGVKVALVDVELATARVSRAPDLPTLPPGVDRADTLAVQPVGDAGSDGFPVIRAGKGESIDADELRATLARLEERQLTVIIALAEVGSPITTAVLTADRPVVLTARSGAVSRAELQDAAETLQRAGMTVSGVILHNGDGSGHPGA